MSTEPRPNAGGWRQFVWEPAQWGVIPLVVIPLSNYLAVAPWGTHVFLMCDLGLLLMAGYFVLSAPLYLLHPTPKSRRQAALNFLCALTIIPGLWGGIIWGMHIRHNGFLQLAIRSAPLVTAIGAFQAREGRPPASLDELVPVDLPFVPGTGMGAYPSYQYVQAPTRYDGNPWALYVFTPSGGINFDIFLYYPLGNYPRTGHGGWLEPIGAWAYVHE